MSKICERCDREMFNTRTAAEARALGGVRGHMRRVCHNCYSVLRSAKRAGRPIPNYRGTKPRNAVAENYAFLRSAGVRVRDMPDRLGMSPAALEKALRRARADGNPDAATFKGMAA